MQDNGDLSAVLPPEVLDTTDAQAIFAAYRRFRDAIRDETLQPLNEAKLLVVGNEATGKTSLTRFLIDGTPRDPSEAKTPGIRKREKIVTQDWSPDESDVQLNVWDFGGQEIMRGTHRFFLIARSLYLLVLENRFEDDAQKVQEWLKTIRSRGTAPSADRDGEAAQESPVIVVINKCDEHADYVRRDDEVSLRNAYPNIVGFFRTSCNDDEYSRNSIQALRRECPASC